MKAAIIIDSTTYATNEIVSLPHVFQVDLNVIFADGSIASDTNEHDDQVKFFNRLENESTLPTTSQPTVGQYYETVDKIIAEGYDTIFAVHLSKEISGTFQSAKMVLDEYKDRITSYCIDSKAASVVSEAIVENIVGWIQEGKEAEEINALALWQADHSDIYLMVEKLDNLAKGGRLSSTSAVIGNLLKIRPILYFTEGRLELFEKVRTNRRVYQRWNELIQIATEEYPDGVNIRFAHVLADEEVERISANIKASFPHINIKSSGLGPVVAAHTGVGAIGMAIIPIINK